MPIELCNALVQSKKLKSHTKMIKTIESALPDFH